MNNSGWRRLVSTRLRRLSASVVIWRSILSTLAHFALGFVLEFFFFFLLLRQFFLTFLVSVIRCCQSMLSSYRGTVPFSRAVARRALHFLSQGVNAERTVALAGDRPASQKFLPNQPKNEPNVRASGALAKSFAWKPTHMGRPGLWGHPSYNPV
jgi:hypothetical protein